MKSINKQISEFTHLFSKHLTGDLIKAVHELSEGVQLSKETESLLRKLELPLPPGDQPIKLFALNYDVEKCNLDSLLDMEGKCRSLIILQC